ncbi:type II secretion system protein GspD [Candidatus Sumerlaeota bacterium]
MQRSKTSRLILAAIAIMLLTAVGSLEAQRSRRGSQATAASAIQGLGEARFEIDPETGSLIVITDETTNERIKDIIARLDRPVPQALIKVLFLEVTHGKDLDLGAEFTYTHTETDGDLDTVASMFGVAANVAGGAHGGAVSVLADDLTVTLRALAQAGKLEVLSRPSIMARNNEEATITVGQEVPFVRNSRITQDGQTINTVEYEEIGIILTVTPRITSQRMVELDVSSEISTLTGETVPISNTIDAPVFAIRSAETRVVVPSGKTIVIGGLMETLKTDAVQKVPILGDLWLIGSLFRRTVTAESKTELLIFLTPMVISTTSEIADATAAAAEETTLIPNAFGVDQLNKYMPMDDALEPGE